MKKNEYKDEDKKVTLIDCNTGAKLEIGAKIRATAQTDLEITFFCFNCFINNTDQKIVLYNADNKKQKLACQSATNFAIVPLSENVSKVIASIDADPATVTKSKAFSQSFPVNLVGISNKITVPKQWAMNYDFILNTTYSLVTPQDDIYIKLTKVDPLFVACN